MKPSKMLKERNEGRFLMAKRDKEKKKELSVERRKGK